MPVKKVFSSESLCTNNIRPHPKTRKGKREKKCLRRLFLSRSVSSPHRVVDEPVVVGESPGSFLRRKQHRGNDGVAVHLLVLIFLLLQPLYHILDVCLGSDGTTRPQPMITFLVLALLAQLGKNLLVALTGFGLFLFPFLAVFELLDLFVPDGHELGVGFREIALPHLFQLVPTMEVRNQVLLEGDVTGMKQRGVNRKLGKA